MKSGWIDLHSHTTASDGSLTPQELISLASQTGLDALAITDHDTFAGYEEAVPFGREADLDLVRGIELNSKLESRHVHLLAYFLSGEPSPEFSAWLQDAPRNLVGPEEVIQIIRSGHGIPVLAHPGRLALARDVERQLLIRWRQAGLVGLEVYHSEHPAPLQAYYFHLAQELDLLPTGGSDFHGTLKPDVRLGTGVEGNVRVPREFLERLKVAISSTS